MLGYKSDAARVNYVECVTKTCAISGDCRHIKRDWVIGNWWDCSLPRTRADVCNATQWRGSSTNILDVITAVQTDVRVFLKVVCEVLRRCTTCFSSSIRMKCWTIKAINVIKFRIFFSTLVFVPSPLQALRKCRWVCLLQYVLSRVRGSVTNNNGFWIGWLDLLTFLLQSARTYRQYSTVTDLRNLQFTVTHALGFPVVTSRILVTELKESRCDYIF
jgi:hypothetical protein